MTAVRTLHQTSWQLSPAHWVVVRRGRDGWDVVELIPAGPQRNHGNYPQRHDGEAIAEAVVATRQHNTADEDEMKRNATLTYDTLDPAGMTLNELRDRLDAMLAAGMPGATLIRVRVKMSGHRHGAPIKAITAADTTDAP